MIFFHRRKRDFHISDDFFTQNGKLSKEVKADLIRLIQKREFRAFEEYLKYKQNRKAHKLLRADTEKESAELRGEIRALGEVTIDLFNLWEQEKMDKKREATRDDKSSIALPDTEE